MPGSWRGRVMAIMAPRPVGSGALMWKGSGGGPAAAPPPPAARDPSRLAALDEPQGALEGDDRAGAGSHLGDDRAGQAVLHRELAGGHRAREGGDGGGADLPPPPAPAGLA